MEASADALPCPALVLAPQVPVSLPWLCNPAHGRELLIGTLIF